MVFSILYTLHKYNLEEAGGEGKYPKINRRLPNSLYLQ